MTKHIDVSERLPESYKIVFGGDTHMGALGFAHTLAKKYIKYISGSKHTYWTCHGDMVDTMLPTDSRFRFENPEPELVDRRPEPRYDRCYDQCEAFLSFFDNIGDRCLEIGEGNHEDRVKNVFPIPQYLAKMWKTDWGTSQTTMNLGAFKAFLFHPFHMVMNFKAGDRQQRYTNECTKIRRSMSDLAGAPSCEVNVMSHIHKIRISKPLCLINLTLLERGKEFKAIYPQVNKMFDSNATEGYYPEEFRWFASTGALFGQYVNGQTTYFESRGFSPTELGWIEAEVRNGKFLGLHEVEV